MRKTLILLCVLPTSLFAQDIEFKAANFKEQKEELKAAVEAIEAADALYWNNREAVPPQLHPQKDDFKKAVLLYSKAQKFNPNSTELNYKLGAHLLFTSAMYDAPPYIDKAATLGGELEPMFHFYNAMALKTKLDFSKAQAELKLFEAGAGDKILEVYGKVVKEMHNGCNAGKSLVESKVRAWVDNLGVLNSEADDFSPCISTDGETMLFSSSRSNGKAKNDLEEYDADIYFSELNNGQWSSPKPIGAPLNTDKSEVATMLAYDGQKMLLHRDVEGNSEIFESKLEGARWSEPRHLHKMINTEDNQTYASYNFDGVKIFFVTDQDAGALGGTDIFFSGCMDPRLDIWGKAITGSKVVNTKLNEGSVYMHPDGHTMYMSSQGHNSLGGYDIFISHNVQGQWTEPVNLGYPINTPYDEMFFPITANGKFAYIASNRPGGKGGMDLYKVTYLGPEKPVMVDSEDYLLASIANPIKEVNIEKAVVVEKKSLTVFKGRIIDAITRKPLEAELEILDNNSAEVISAVKSNSATGKFLLSLPSGRNYGIAVKKEGYLFHSENFNLPEIGEFNMVDKEVELKNISVGSKIALRNVFFATGKAEITNDSRTELDRLITLLKDVASLKIELGGHTDNVGSESSNQKLSQDRAQAVVAYLTGKGIAASRMTAKGYGSTEPVASNNSEEGRAHNRRTEFKIVGN